MQRYNGRPQDAREVIEEQVYDLLENLHISFDRVDHEAAYTMDVCGEIETTLQAPVYKNLFLSNTQQTKFYLLVMCGDKKFNTKEVSKQLNVARLSFGKEDKMVEFLSCNKGSASILGILFDYNIDVTLLMDDEILESDYFGCHPCKNTSTLRIQTKDMIEKIIPYSKHEITYVKIQRPEN